MIDYKLYVIRHGITKGNLEGRYIGSTDLPLCPEGEEQLRKLMEEREYPEVKKVYTSPMQRCLDTAEVLYPDSHIQLIPELKEYDFGIFDGRKASELKDDEDFARWAASGMREAPEGGETMENFLRRCEDGFARVVEDMMRNRITEAALILHGGVLMNLMAAHAYPQREPVYWQVEPGEGYTLLITPQIWHRGQVVEAFDPIPYSREVPEEEPSFYQFFDLLDELDDVDEEDFE
ncbi:MAG: histidine phosphatase family protein [Oscillospiraceae bacterium]|nr:histidine phosphatase family protein [Oscillospiraceae bacterium]